MIVGLDFFDHFLQSAQCEFRLLELAEREQDGNESHQGALFDRSKLG